MVELLKVTAHTPVDETEYMDQAAYDALLARQLAESAARYRSRVPMTVRKSWVARFRDWLRA